MPEACCGTDRDLLQNTPSLGCLNVWINIGQLLAVALLQISSAAILECYLLFHQSPHPRRLQPRAENRRALPLRCPRLLSPLWSDLRLLQIGDRTVAYQLYGFLFSALAITGIEAIISSINLNGGDSWTYGQVFAVAMLVAPLLELITYSFKKSAGFRRVKMKSNLKRYATNIALNINLWPFFFWLYFLVPYYLLVGYLEGANIPDILLRVGSAIIILFPFQWVAWALFQFLLLGRYDPLASSSPIRRRVAIINRPTGLGQGQSTIVRLWLNQTYPIPARTGSEVSVRVDSRWRKYGRSLGNVLAFLLHIPARCFGNVLALAVYNLLAPTFWWTPFLILVVWMIGCIAAYSHGTPGGAEDGLDREEARA